MVTLARFSTRCFLLCGIAVACNVLPPCVGQTPAAIRNCKSLPACLAVVDDLARTPRNGDGVDPGFAASLRRFGEPAKQALLKRASEKDSGRQELAQAILLYWKSWSPADVPALRAGLQMDHGGWLAVPLGEIGTREAIAALVEDLPKSEEGNQTEFALSKLGLKAVPALFPLLQDEKTAPSVVPVLADMEASALPAVPEWSAFAMDLGQRERVRLGALRGIAAIGVRARSASNKLPALLNDPNPAIRQQALATLKAVGNAAVAHLVGAMCRPSAPQFDELAHEALDCLTNLATFGSNGRSAGPDLMPFLSSENAMERIYAIKTLGYIDYAAASPQIEDALTSTDWRIVFAAVHTLGQLGDKDAEPELQNLARSHWLPELREEATRVLAALKSPKRRLETDTSYADDWRGRLGFLAEDAVLGHQPVCKTHRWVWHGKPFRVPIAGGGEKASRIGASVPFQGGTLFGTDIGEWGGHLVWRRQGHPDEEIHTVNVTSVARDGEDAVAVFGLSHMTIDFGYALLISHPAQGVWEKSEVARLPASAKGMTTISPGTFAVLSAGRVVVFTRGGIQGLASCANQ